MDSIKNQVIAILPKTDRQSDTRTHKHDHYTENNKHFGKIKDHLN